MSSQATQGAQGAQQVMDAVKSYAQCLGYAVTAYGAQGASERFAITLEGVEAGRKVMAAPDAGYVAMSRHKEHVQVYTDNLEGWISAVQQHQGGGHGARCAA